MSPYPLYQGTTIKICQNFLAKDLKDQCIGKNIKQKVTSEYRCFLISNFVVVTRLLVLVYSRLFLYSADDNAKRF